MRLSWVQFSSILTLIMCADPSPLSDEDDKHLRDWANEEAKHFGFIDWIDAYHKMKP